MKPLSFLILLTLTFQVHAKQFSQVFDLGTYDQALNNKDFIRFDMESTKAGMVTTSFSGVVRIFKVVFEAENNQILKGVVDFKVGALDTDSDGRNEKMYNDCFNLIAHPNLQINFSGPLTYSEKDKLISGKIKLRGYERPITLKLSTLKKGDIIEVKGSSQISLKQLGIPDPSIWIASVRDRVDIHFKVNLNLNK